MTPRIKALLEDLYRVQSIPKALREEIGCALLDAPTSDRGGKLDVIRVDVNTELRPEGSGWAYWISGERFRRLDSQEDGLVAAALQAAVLAQAPPTNRDGWLIQFDDADKRPEVFMGEGAESAARARFQHISLSWNAHLFRLVESNTCDAQIGPARVHAPHDFDPAGRCRRCDIEEGDPGEDQERCAVTPGGTV